MQPRRETGAVAVEFGLVLPLLAMLMLGIITFGMAYNDKIALTNTVREGSRFGATVPTDGDKTTADWGPAVLTRTLDLYSNPAHTLPSANVCGLLAKKTSTGFDVIERTAAGCESPNSAAGALPDTPSSLADGTCYVMVWAQLDSDLNWLLGSMPITLRARSVSAYGRTSTC